MIMAVILVIGGMVRWSGFRDTEVNAEPAAASEQVDFLTVSSGLTLTMEKKESSGDSFLAEAVVKADSIPDGSAVILKLENVPTDVEAALEKSILLKGESAKVTFAYNAAGETVLKDISRNVKLSGEVVKNYADTQELNLDDWEYHIEKRSNLDSGFVADRAYLVLDRYCGNDVDVNVYASYYFTEAMHNDMVSRGFAITDVTLTSDDYGMVLPTMLAPTDYDTYVASQDPDNPDTPDDSELDTDYSYGPFIDNWDIETVTFYNGIYDNKPISVNMSRLKNYDVIVADNCLDRYRSDKVMFDNEDIYSHLDKDDDDPDRLWYSIELDENGNNKLTYKTYNDMYSMKGMFAFCESLKTVNNIPDNVNVMTNTFRNCTAFESVSNLPEELIDMEKTFFNCTNMTTVPQIPEGVVDMLATFKNCKKLNPSEAVVVPEGVRNLMETFRGCQSMVKAPIINPDTRVYNLNHTFYNCKVMEELPILPMSVISLFRTFNGCASATKVQNDNPHIIGNYDNMVITQNGILSPGCDSSNISDTIGTLPDWLGYNLLDTYRGCKKLNIELYINSENGFNYIDYDRNEGYGPVTATYKSYGYFRSCANEMYERYYYRNKAGKDIESSKWYLDHKTAEGVFWEASLDTSGVTAGNGIKLYSNDSDVLTDISGRFVSLGNGVSHSVATDGETSTGATVIETFLTSVDDIKAKTITYVGPEEPAAEVLSTAMEFKLSARIANEVKYYSYSGTLLDTVRVPAGQTISAMTGPDKQDVTTDHSVLSYSFDKWVYKDNVQEAFNFSVPVAADTELIASYTETETLNEYTVKFYDEDKTTLLDEVTVEWGKSASTSVTPTKSQEITETKITTYTFDKWVDEDGHDVDLTNVVGNMNVYASYSEKVVSVVGQELDHIEIVKAPDKVNYLYGENFVRTGMVVDAIYKIVWSDGKTEYKTVGDVAYHVDTTTSLVETDTAVEVSFTDGVTKYASQPVTVENYIVKTVLDRIIVSKQPDKTAYIEGECFDDTGMIVDAVYKEHWANGTITEKEQKNVRYDVDKTTKLKVSDSKWQVSYTDGVTVYAYVNISVTEEVKDRFVTVKGTLKYSDGTPIANKKLVLHSEIKTAYTDNNGNYEFLSVEVGEHTLNIYSDNDLEIAVCRINVSPTAESDSIDISKKENCEVTNKISGDEFVVNVLVTLNEPEETKPEEGSSEESQPESSSEESRPEESQPESNPEESRPEETKPEESSWQETSNVETEVDDTPPSTGDGNTALMLIMMMAGISGIILLLSGISYASEEKEKKR